MTIDAGETFVSACLRPFKSISAIRVIVVGLNTIMLPKPCKLTYAFSLFSSVTQHAAAFGGICSAPFLCHLLSEYIL